MKNRIIDVRRILKLVKIFLHFLSVIKEELGDH